MDLDRRGREYLVLQIDTEPEVTGWEASFDDGESWKPAQEVPSKPGQWRWLLAGPDAPAGSAVALELGQHEVLLKATDNPEIIVREHDIFVTVT